MGLSSFSMFKLKSLKVNLLNTHSTALSAIAITTTMHCLDAALLTLLQCWHCICLFKQHCCPWSHKLQQLAGKAGHAAAVEILLLKVGIAAIDAAATIASAVMLLLMILLTLFFMNILK